MLTTGDNVYLGREHGGATGAEDDDWFEVEPISLHVTSGEPVSLPLRIDV